MSRERRREWLDITYLEAGHFYRFPLMECIMVFFLYLSFLAVYWIALKSQSTSFIPGSTWNGTWLVEQVLSYESTTATFGLSLAIEDVWLATPFIVPILVAFTTAKTFEDGTLRTVLSYPVKRSHLLMMRTLVPFFIIGAITTISTLLTLPLFLPMQLDISSILLLTASYWMADLLITCSIVLVWLVTKKMIITALGGVVLWYGLFSLTYIPGVPVIARWMINPVNMVKQYLLGGRNSPWQHLLGDLGESGSPLIGDVLFTFAVMALVSVVLLVASLKLFRRMEV